MSDWTTPHLGHGSKRPAKIDGSIRLYGMKFCPFAHRVRLALDIKQLTHDVVNINLQNKPEWYYQIHPESKVPALVDVDGRVVVDSTVIVNYLDEKYPTPPLYNSITMTKDLELITTLDKIVKIFSNCIHKKETRPLQEAVNEMSNYLNEFETELKARNTDFFKGDSPGIIDILMWPFAERAKAIPIIWNEQVVFVKESFPKVMQWISVMRNQEFVKNNAMPYESFAKVVQAGSSVNYDEI